MALTIPATVGGQFITLTVYLCLHHDVTEATHRATADIHLYLLYTVYDVTRYSGKAAAGLRHHILCVGGGVGGGR